MNDKPKQVDMSKARVVLDYPGMDDVVVMKSVAYHKSDNGTLVFDIYYPPGSEAPVDLPVVIFATGYPDPGYEAMMGSKMKDTGAYQSWCRLVAARGMAGVVCETIDPAKDIRTLIDYVRRGAPGFGINADKIGVWSCSGNTPNALQLLTDEFADFIKCAVLAYGYMLDDDRSTFVADMSRQFGFANPSSGMTLEDLSPTIPLQVIRAEDDQIPHLNESIDAFVAMTAQADLPIEIVDARGLGHAFDISEDSDASRAMIEYMLQFLERHLGPTGPNASIVLQ